MGRSNASDLCGSCPRFLCAERVSRRRKRLSSALDDHVSEFSSAQNLSGPECRSDVVRARIGASSFYAAARRILYPPAILSRFWQHRGVDHILSTRSLSTYFSAHREHKFVDSVPLVRLLRL